MFRRGGSGRVGRVEAVGSPASGRRSFSEGGAVLSLLG